MMGRVRFCCFFLFVLVGPASLTQISAQETTTTITTITGQRVTLDLEQISDGVISGPGQTLKLDEAMLLETGRRIVPQVAPVQVMLTGGGWLNADRVAFAGEGFQVTTAWGLANIPPDAVTGLVLDRGADRTRFDRALADRSVEMDVVIAKTSQGQTAVAGLLESIDGEKAILNYQGRSRPIKLAKIAGIITADLKPALPPAPQCSVRLVDGGSASGTLIGMQAGRFEIGLPGQAILRFPWGEVASVALSSSAVMWLSDLEPASAEHTPLATLPFEWQRDRSADGNPLTLRWPSSGETQQFTKGIGTRSASRLEFLNRDGFHRLVATVGIDVEMQGRGNCEASVWGDGIQLWSAEISGRTDPVALDVPISDMDRITLVVRHGKNLDLGDHVNWAEARFVKIDQ